MLLDEDMEDISVVIPVRNDPLLTRAIDSVPRNTELIVAMTAPPETVLEQTHRLVQGRRARVVVTDRIGMAAGVNLGARAASRKKVVILDSDCYLLDETLQAYSHALDQAPFVRGMTLVERDSYWSRVAALGIERLNRTFAKHARFFGPSIAFRKAEFFQYDGYDECMVHGSCDHEFALRLERHQVAVRFVEEAVIFHRSLSFGIDTRSHVGYGRGMCYIDRKHGRRYGLSVCAKRLSLRELYTRAVERGAVSVLRSILLGHLMLYGYLKELTQGDESVDTTS